ncbi:MAG: hypothetical protein AVDCRST_MAG56-112, partial [uncultured Cytophagales bacterium]
ETDHRTLRRAGGTFARRRGTRHCPTRRLARGRVPGLQAFHCRPRRPAPSLRGQRIQLQPDELDQAQLPVDDVPVGLGHQTRPGSHSRHPDRQKPLRADAGRGRAFFVRARPVPHVRRMAGSAGHLGRTLAVGPRPRPVRGQARTPGNSTGAPRRGAAAVRHRLDRGHRGHYALRGPAAAVRGKAGTGSTDGAGGAGRRLV